MDTVEALTEKLTSHLIFKIKSLSLFKKVNKKSDAPFLEPMKNLNETKIANLKL